MLKRGNSSQILLQNNQKKAVLLLHCFRNSPAIFREYAAAFYQAGYSVYNMRLPGHGYINEEKIFEVTLRDWQLFTEHQFFDLMDRYETVHLCGFSLGASLLADLIQKYELKNKTVLIAPVFKIRQKYAPLLYFYKYFKKKLKPSEPDCSLDYNDDFMTFFPVSQGYEIYRITKIIQRNFHKIQTPVLTFLAKNDHDVHFEDQINIIKQNSSFQIEVLEKSFHLAVVDVEKDRVLAKMMEWLGE